jgi:hypothetical protein
MPQTNGAVDTKLVVAQYVGALLFIAILESHLVSRPVAFLVGPFVVWICLFLASPSGRGMWRTLALAALASSLGYLLMRFVFVKRGG